MDAAVMGAWCLSSHLLHSVVSKSGWNVRFLCREEMFCVTFRVERHSRWAENGLKVILLFWIGLSLVGLKVPTMKALSSFADYWRVFSEIKCDDIPRVMPSALLKFFVFFLLFFKKMEMEWGKLYVKFKISANNSVITWRSCTFSVGRTS